jgi:hypothetical protein
MAEEGSNTANAKIQSGKTRGNKLTGPRVISGAVLQAGNT